MTAPRCQYQGVRSQGPMSGGGGGYAHGHTPSGILAPSLWYIHPSLSGVSVPWYTRPPLVYPPPGKPTSPLSVIPTPWKIPTQLDIPTPPLDIPNPPLDIPTPSPGHTHPLPWTYPPGRDLATSQKAPGTRDAHSLPFGQNDWQMPVKTLPPCNYCCGR